MLGKEKWSEERADETAHKLCDGDTEACLPPHPDHVQVGKTHCIGLQVINTGLNPSSAILESRKGPKTTRVSFWHEAAHILYLFNLAWPFLYFARDIDVFYSKMLSLALLGELCNRQYMSHITILISEKSQILQLSLSPVTLNKIFL